MGGSDLWASVLLVIVVIVIRGKETRSGVGKKSAIPQGVYCYIALRIEVMRVVR